MTTRPRAASRAQISLRARCVLLAAALCVPAVAAGEGLRVLVLGDSLSAAYGIAVHEGWVQLLGRRLGEWAVARDLPAPQVVNASVSGDTTGGGLSRLPRALNVHMPDVVIVELGGNDGLRGQPVRSASANLEAIINQVTAAGARAVMIGVRMPPNYGPAYTEAFSKMFEQLAERHEIPLAPRFLEGIALDSELMQPDGIHPTAAAQTTLLDNAWPAIESALSAAVD